MKNEFVFGPRDEVDRFARTKRWEPNGRAAWIRHDGGFVDFLAVEEQLAALAKGERVYVVGKLSDEGRRDHNQNVSRTFDLEEIVSADRSVMAVQLEASAEINTTVVMIRDLGIMVVIGRRGRGRNHDFHFTAGVLGL